MPYKNDNLEELFKNAANDYPLRTDNSNWNSVATKLQDTAVSTNGRNKSLVKYAALLFLLLGGTIFYFKLQPLTKDDSPSSKEVYTNTQKKISSEPAASSPIRESSTAALNDKTASVKNSNLFAEKKQAVSSSGNIQNNYNNATKIDVNQIVNKNNFDKTKDSKTPASINENQYTLNNFTTNKNENVVNGQNVKQGLTNSQASKAVHQVKFNHALSKFYGTLYGSPEFSMVKFQKVSKPGYKIGVALGYRINNNFSIQLGLERDHINYYTDGKYFDKSGLHLKETAALESVNASSKLTSVPVTLQYNLLNKKNGHLFTSLGANIVALTHTENYEYIVSKNGNENDVSRSFGSVTNPKYFTSINASIGYETKLFRQYNLNIEPYYQLPIRNIGVGNLPVTSFGVNIGIVKDLK
ncbi:MAG: hypothetical protein JO072_00265 [Parafilimonas sp.]|nr:hypothetical protein [Parafilimonas sp.]